MRWPIFAAMLAAAIGAPPVFAADRPIVVELFTSEGCSSCPPADRFLSELARSRRDVLPLAFHVTYWNSLGWRDPFSLAASTARQNDYADHFGNNSVFTPQMVVDGSRSVVGSDRSKAFAAIESARDHTAAASVHLTLGGGRLQISVGKGEGRGRILLVGFDHEHTTAIGRGENSGQTLIETNIVRSINAVADWTGAAITLSASPPVGEETAVLLQAPDGAIIGAARSRS